MADVELPATGCAGCREPLLDSGVKIGGSTGRAISAREPGGGAYLDDGDAAGNGVNSGRVAVRGRWVKSVLAVLRLGPYMLTSSTVCM